MPKSSAPNKGICLGAAPYLRIHMSIELESACVVEEDRGLGNRRELCIAKPESSQRS